MSDPEVFAGLLQMPYPSVEAWRKNLEQQVEQHDGLHLLAIDNGEVIASGGIHSVGSRMRRRHVAGLGICIARERQGQGIGSEMMTRLLDWADNWAGYLRIELTVYADNQRAIALYRRFGFEMEGTHRAHAQRRIRRHACDGTLPSESAAGAAVALAIENGTSMRILLVLFLVLSISGCAVVAVGTAVGSAAVAVGSAAVSVGSTVVGVTTDAVVGTAKVIGSAVTPGDDKPAGK